MNCAEIRPLLHAYADGQLDLVRNLDVERHIKTCAACAAETKSLQSLSDALRNNGLACRAPDTLRKSVRQMVRESTSPQEKSLQWLWKWLAIGATTAAVLAIVLRPAGISPHDELLNEAIASHVRSLMANHLTDVASSDQHTVKPWFDGKLDFAPNVKDFAEQGFSLVGGRLDYLDGRAVAALVYRHEKHLINVFVWPAANTERGTEQIENVRGYNVVTCDIGGFHYCLVSDVEEKQLHQLGGLFEK